MVNLRTSVTNANRRAGMNESARKRFEATEQELRDNVKELEEALQKHVSLLHSARQSETHLTKKVATMVHRDIHENLSDRMAERERELIGVRQELSALRREPELVVGRIHNDGSTMQVPHIFNVHT